MSDDHEVLPLSGGDLRNCLWHALAIALSHLAPDDALGDPGKVRRRRSQHFVRALGNALADHYAASTDVRVFCSGRPRGMFARREEFLFDVLVARVDTVTSPVHKAPLPFICAPLLQVESEFARNTRETILDASKLVCGAAPQSLVVAPATPRPNNYLATLEVIARRVRGEMFVALVQHPAHWNAATPEP